MFALRRLPATAWPLATRSLSTMAPKAACACGPVEACCNAVAAPAIADTTLLAAEATPAPSMVERVTEALRNGKQALETSLEDLMKQSIWLAVPKRKKSYSRKRMRFLNPKSDLPNKNHVYPCPKCDKGLLKVHHHLCPCDMKKLGIYAPETKYGSYSNKASPPTA